MAKIQFPQGPIVDDKGMLSLEWFMWLQNPQVASIIISTAVAVSSGGTGITSGTSGGVLAFTDATTIKSSDTLANHAIVIGGGVGAAPKTSLPFGKAGQLLASAGNNADPIWFDLVPAAQIGILETQIFGG